MNEVRPSNVAYHEAGHAAARIALGNVFRCVSILADGDYLGYVDGTTIPEDFCFETATTADFEREMTTLLAGNLAEELAGYPECEPTDADWERILECAWRIGGDGKGTGECIERLRRETREWLASPRMWPTVEALAKALMQTPCIDGQRARQIASEAQQAAAEFENGRA